jgi:hypothetical protein
MIEPKRVDPRSLRVRSRVGDRHGIACCKSRHRLLRRIDNAVHAAVSIFELKYRIDLLAVRALEADDCTLYIGGSRRRALVVAVENHASENEYHSPTTSRIKRRKLPPIQKGALLTGREVFGGIGLQLPGSELRT